ncbi:MAG: PP2C family protein-serine/threonine phosphatase [Ignavibacteriaceae bacterium]|nr:PP2C family protein-serine/threonine phosphatase [Ignavibacteriaceae bacterium]
MIEPKEFYRKLDSILNKIGQAKSGKDFLFTILKEIEKTFGEALRIGNGRIYEQNGDEFIFIYASSKTSVVNIAKNIPINSEAIQSILNSQTYIFDNPSFSIGELQTKSEYAIPVAITVNNPDNRWIFVFELKSGWIREEIEFCLNAVRSSLNYRLFSESVKSELEQAVQIQKSLLPTKPPKLSGYDIAGHSQPAELVGGDLYDYFESGGQEFGFCIGDASGHGIPAALMARDVITGLRMGIEKHMKMIHTLKKLNSVIYRGSYSTRFVSLFCAEMEEKGNLFYVNAGHPAPLLFSNNKVTELETSGTVFGALPEIELSRSFINLPINSILVLFSDGICERRNNKGAEFGLDNLKSVVQQNQKLSAEEILKSIFSAADEFGGRKKWKDDATAMVIKRFK